MNLDLTFTLLLITGCMIAAGYNWRALGCFVLAAMSVKSNVQ